MMSALLTDGAVHSALHTVTVCGAGHAKTVDQAVWVTKMVSVVPLDTSAVVVFSKEATANLKMMCILDTVTENLVMEKDLSREGFLAV
jgi:hypothetical protein